MWQEDPDKFKADRSALERARFESSWKMIEKYLLDQKKIVDLGCGHGEMLARIAEQGSHNLLGVDIAPAAIQKMQELYPHIPVSREKVPLTKLHDKQFDLVICRDLIAELHSKEYRLLFSEISRIVKEDGYLFCSTPIDIDSKDALQRFFFYVTTEFEPLEVELSYQGLYIRCDRLLKKLGTYGAALRKRWKQSDRILRCLPEGKSCSYAHVLAKRRNHF